MKTPLDRLTAPRASTDLVVFDGTSYGLQRRPWIVSTPRLTDDGRAGLGVIGADSADEARARALTMFLQFPACQSGLCVAVDAWTIEPAPREIPTQEDMLYVCMVLGVLEPGNGTRLAGFTAEGRTH